MNRRRFCAIAGGALASVAFGTACRRSSASLPNNGKLSPRPRNLPTSTRSYTTGQPIKLGLDQDRDALLYLPRVVTNSANTPDINSGLTSATGSAVPLLMFLHGATQSAEDMFWYLHSAPEEAGVAILAPNSRGTTWDAISNIAFDVEFGPDVEFLNRALERVFESVAIDPTRIAVGGFSDGATYAIALGLINGDLFKRVAAFSPGFVIDGANDAANGTTAAEGKTRFFISHGTRDKILPIDRCGRRVAADLKERRYEVTFREFDGGHGIPADVMREGLRWVASH